MIQLKIFLHRSVNHLSALMGTDSSGPISPVERTGASLRLLLAVLKLTFGVVYVLSVAISALKGLTGFMPVLFIVQDLD